MEEQKGPGSTPPSLWNHTIDHVPVDGTGHLSQWPSPKTQTGQNKSPSPWAFLSTSLHILPPGLWRSGRRRWGQVPSACLSFSISLSAFPIPCPTHLNVFSAPTFTRNCSWQRLQDLPFATGSAYLSVFIWWDRLKEFEAGIFPNFQVACLTSHLPGGSSRVCFLDSTPDWLLN